MTDRRGLFVRTLLALLLAAVILIPLSMMLTVSLNPSEEQIQISLGTLKAFVPHTVSLLNYEQVLTDPFHPFGRYLLNTLLIVLTTVGLGVFVNSAAAFALAWGVGGYRKVFLAVVIALYVIPVESVMLPLLLMVSRLGWVDTYHVQILPFIANSFAIFLFYQFFAGLPRELIEAARMDGARLTHVYFRIALPLSGPIIATVGVLGFLEVWNSYLWPVMVTRGPEVRPLAVAMVTFFNSQESYWGNIMAFAMMMTAPVIAVFLAFQRFFVASIMRAGVKG